MNKQEKGTDYCLRGILKNVGLSTPLHTCPSPMYLVTALPPHLSSDAHGEVPLGPQIGQRGACKTAQWLNKGSLGQWGFSGKVMESFQSPSGVWIVLSSSMCLALWESERNNNFPLLSRQLHSSEEETCGPATVERCKG